MLEIIDSGNLSHVTSRGAYMPSVTQLSDNSLIACQHVGEALGSPDNHIEVLRSADSAKTWMNQGSIHEGGPPQAGWMYRGPDIQQAPDGRLVMTATRFEVGDGALFDPDSEALQRPVNGFQVLSAPYVPFCPMSQCLIFQPFTALYSILGGTRQDDSQRCSSIVSFAECLQLLDLSLPNISSALKTLRLWS